MTEIPGVNVAARDGIPLRNLECLLVPLAALY